jgi:hypothetical protein
VKSFRGNLQAKILQLSETWKEEKEKEAPDAKKDESSDSDIDIEDVTPAPTTKPPASKGNARAHRFRG